MDLKSRKWTRTKSHNAGRKSLWHRKSSKKATGATATSSRSSPPNVDTTLPLAMDPVGGKDAHSDSETVLSSSLSHSIIPDPLGELPARFKRESEVGSANPASFRIKYPIHNPQGPPWYKNHHLIPASALNPPPSFFSPSFPHIPPAVQDISDDLTRYSAPSRSPSGTPLPTPSSSQVRIPEPGGKPRSRKTSQDNIDLMDVSDPSGAHWHHESPYDAGCYSTSALLDQPEGAPRSRSRLSSLNTGQTRHKTVTPSPLSQSTSAVHLHVSPCEMTHKLSKRRKPFSGLFSHNNRQTDDAEAPSSAPPAPSSVARRASTLLGSSHFATSTTRRHSTLFPLSISSNASSLALSSHSSNRRSKRGNVFSRMVRRFSVLGRSIREPVTMISESVEDDKSISGGKDAASRRSVISQRQPSPDKSIATEKKYLDPPKRVPPPRIDSDLLTQAESGGGPSMEFGREIGDHRSSISSDIPFSPFGKLMITNPDAPSSGGTSPVRENVDLPLEGPVESPLVALCAAKDERRASFSSRIAGTGSRDTKEHSSELMPPSSDSLQPGPLSNEKRTSVSPSSTGTLVSPPVNYAVPAERLLSPLAVPLSSPPVPEVASADSSAQFVSPRESPSPTPEPALSPNVLVAPPLAHPIPRPSLPHLIVPGRADSPLSRASMFVNPPTPCDTGSPRTETEAAQQPVKQSHSSPPSRDPSPQKLTNVMPLAKSNSTSSRKTETFKLVRSPSQTKSFSESIMAEGEQWLLVNAEGIPRRRRTKDRGEKGTRTEKTDKPPRRDGESKREQKKPEKVETRTSGERQRATSQVKRKSPTVDKIPSAKPVTRPTRARSLDTPQRPAVLQPVLFMLQGDPPRTRTSGDRQREQRDSGRSRQSRSGPAPVVSTARPTSELTSTADLNAFRAREAWHMDRLMKGRSVHQYQGQSEAASFHPPAPGPKEFKPTKGDATSMHSATNHGSSHTSYVVQPLQAHPIPASVFYANMPAAPPSIIYPAASSYQRSSQDYHTVRSLPDFTFPPKELSTDPPPGRSPNPLPAPPRESTYQPAHLPALVTRGNGATPEYRTKYTSVPSH